MTWKAGWRFGILSTVPYEQQKIYRQIILFQRIYYLSISLTGLPCHREPSIVSMSMLQQCYFFFFFCFDKLCIDQGSAEEHFAEFYNLYLIDISVIFVWLLSLCRGGGLPVAAVFIIAGLGHSGKEAIDALLPLGDWLGVVRIAPTKP